MGEIVFFLKEVCLRSWKCVENSGDDYATLSILYATKLYA